MESRVRSVAADGLVWGACMFWYSIVHEAVSLVNTAKILPVAYGIKKLQISCVIEDDKIGTDFLEESILQFEDLVSKYAMYMYFTLQIHCLGAKCWYSGF